jgi:hypothetical protein
MRGKVITENLQVISILQQVLPDRQKQLLKTKKQPIGLLF